MQIASLIRCYGLTQYLKAVIKSYDWVDRVLVMNYRFMNVVPIEDKTREIAEGLGQKNIVVESGESTDQHQVLSLGVERLQDYDLIFISDADELIARSDQKRMVDEMKGKEVGKCWIIDYARDFEHIFPIRGHQPITIVRPTAKFVDVRCVGIPTHTFPGINVHHFGYVYPPDEMSWKVNWERPWEHNTVINLLAQIPQPYEMPSEIKEMLCVD